MDSSKTGVSKGKRVKHVASKSTRSPAISSTLAAKSKVIPSALTASIPSIDSAPVVAGVSVPIDPSMIKVGDSGKSVSEKVVVSREIGSSLVKETAPSSGCAKALDEPEVTKESRIEKFRRILQVTKLKKKGKLTRKISKGRGDVSGPTSAKGSIEQNKESEREVLDEGSEKQVIEEFLDSVQVSAEKDVQLESVVKGVSTVPIGEDESAELDPDEEPVEEEKGKLSEDPGMEEPVDQEESAAKTSVEEAVSEDVALKIDEVGVKETEVESNKEGSVEGVKIAVPHMAPQESVAPPSVNDSEFEELLEQADQFVELELSQKKRKLETPQCSKGPARRKESQEATRDASDSDSVEILKPSMKKAKVAFVNPPKTGKTRASKKGSGAGGVVQEKGEAKKKFFSVNDVWFSSELAMRNWSVVKGRRLVVEGVFVESKWNVPEIVQCLEKANLICAVKAPRPFDEQLVRELVANISMSFGDVLDVDYGCVTVRGTQVIFSPRLINEMLGISIGASVPSEVNWDDIAKILTGGRVRKWKGLTIESKFLTTKFALLQGICIRNWIPVTHRATISKQVAGLIYHVSCGKQPDLGQIIFDQLASLASISSSSLPIGHPSTIYQLLIRLAPGLADSHSALTVPKPLVVDWKVFSFGHVVDISIPESVLQALKRRGKMVKDEPSSLHKSEIDQLKEQLLFLDKARAITAALLADKEHAQGDKVSEEEAESSSDTDSGI